VRELDVVGVRVEMPSNQPIVLLRERGGDRYLPIWVGAPEATAIAHAQQGIVPPRPLTHDLLRDVIQALGRRLVEVRIVAIKDNVFHAELVFDGGQLKNGSLADYMVPSFEDMPRSLSVGLLENPEKNEVHGLGEPSLPPVMAAVGNAVFRATGVRVRELPITPEKVLRGLREPGDADGRRNGRMDAGGRWPKEEVTESVAPHQHATSTAGEGSRHDRVSRTHYTDERREP
jgi:bifunctional DNase/RNase